MIRTDDLEPIAAFPRRANRPRAILARRSSPMSRRHHGGRPHRPSGKLPALGAQSGPAFGRSESARMNAASGSPVPPPAIVDPPPVPEVLNRDVPIDALDAPNGHVAGSSNGWHGSLAP